MTADRPSGGPVLRTTDDPNAAVQARALADPRIRKVFDYWSGKCRDDVLPSRRDIDPVDIHDCLSWLMILDVVDGGADFRIRLAGSQVEEAHDRALKGVMIGAMGEGEELAALLARFRKVVATRAPDFRSASLSMVGRAFIEFDRVALPLAEDGRTVTHLLCCYAQRARDGGR
ncbi:MAG: PAS domain-containing protein [Alphaproteobacteria bacterium]